MFSKSASTSEIIKTIVDQLVLCDRLPKHCDLSQIGPLHLASFYSDQPQGSVIRADVQCGMDLDQDLAILKALVECVERLAIEEAISQGSHVASTHRSDGFAAFPIFPVGTDAAASMARNNAEAEAVERFTWAHWWDDLRLACKISDCDRIELDAASSQVLKSICDLAPIKEKWLVQPLVNSAKQVFIFFLRLSNGGIVSGGACSESRCEGHLHALGELARHVVAATRLFEGATASTFYERRLEYMITPSAGNELVKRLSVPATTILELPTFEVDESVSHQLQDIIAVHRCLFHHQPPFVGGALERLCL